MLMVMVMVIDFMPNHTGFLNSSLHLNIGLYSGKTNIG